MALQQVQRHLLMGGDRFVYHFISQVRCSILLNAIMARVTTLLIRSTFNPFISRTLSVEVDTT